MRTVQSFGLLALAAPSFVALFFLRGKRWRRLLALIVRLDLMLMQRLTMDPDTLRFLVDFPAMIADDTVDRDS